MKLFRRSKKPEKPLLDTAMGRKDAIEKLESLGYFVRPKRIRKPKVGDTVRFRVGGSWSTNSWYYQTGTMIEFKDTDPERPFGKYGYIRVEKRRKNGSLLADHIVHPNAVVRVTKAIASTSHK